MSNLREATTRLRSVGGAGWYGATAVTGGSSREQGVRKRSTAPVGFPESWRMLYLEAVASKGWGERGVFGMSIELRPIGFVRTDAPELPRHWSVSDVEGTLVIDEEYSEGLRDIEAVQRIVVIFTFHRSLGLPLESTTRTASSVQTAVRGRWRGREISIWFR
jgi:hypothetical protein